MTQFEILATALFHIASLHVADSPARVSTLNGCWELLLSRNESTYDEFDRICVEANIVSVHVPELGSFTGLIKYESVDVVEVYLPSNGNVVTLRCGIRASQESFLRVRCFDHDDPFLPVRDMQLRRLPEHNTD